MKTHIQQTLERALADDEQIALATGFERAFVGVARQFGKPFAVYSRPKCLQILEDQEMSPEEAEEWMSFNTEGAWVGENTPAFMEPVGETGDSHDGMGGERVLLLLAAKSAVLGTLIKRVIDYIDPELAESPEEKEDCAAALRVLREVV